MKRITFILSALACLIILTNSVKAQESLLWQVSSSEGKTSYIFGTYHLVGSEYLDAHPKVASAYSKSSTIVVETIIDSAKLMEAATMAFMNGHTLWDYYDTTQFQTIDTVIRSVTGMSLSSLVQMKPIAIAMLYTLSIAQKDIEGSQLDFSGQPIDVYFASHAEKKGKDVVTLETMMEQMKILYDSDPLEKQAQALLEVIEDTTVESLSIELLRLYQNEDLSGMYSLSQEVEDSYGDMAVLLDNRNQNWIAKLTPLLDKGEAFIAVGALHLPGDQGLLNLLESSGYIIKPVVK